LELLCTGTELEYEIFSDSTLIHSDTLTTVADVQQVYEIQLPKGVNASLMRIIIYSEDVFHRFSARLRYDESGNGTKFKTVKV
jgi:hypothetical protein